MMGTLDWKWIGIGVVVMIALSLVAGLVLGHGNCRPPDIVVHFALFIG